MSEHSHEHDKAGCHALLNDLSAYLDGEAEEKLCQEIERHIKECEDCRVVVDTLSRTVKLYREHGHAHLPSDARQRLFVALDLSEYLDE